MPKPNSPNPIGIALPNAYSDYAFKPLALDERFLIEEYDHRASSFGPNKVFTASTSPEYGLGHPTKNGYRLVMIAKTDKPGVYRWIWANEGNHEDTNNFGIFYDKESASHPGYIRRYTVLRDTWQTAYGSTGPAYRQPLKVVVGLLRTAGGSTSKKNGVYDLVFSGGGGSGAAGKFEVSKGTIISQWITDCGTGYTSAPTVDAPGVDDFAITAYVQSQTAVLVEYKAEPPSDELASMFLNVTAVYRTLPGPIITSSRWDPERNVRLKITRQARASDDSAVTSPSNSAGTIQIAINGIDSNISEIVTEATTDGSRLPDKTEIIGKDPKTGQDIYRITKYVETGTALPTFSTSYSIDGKLRYVFDAKRTPLTDVTDIQTILAVGIPANYIEYENVGFQFPGIFKFATGYTWNSSVATRFPPPWPGDGVEDGTYYFEPPRSALYPGRITHIFTYGAPTAGSPGFSVTTPGVMSRYFRIPPNTLHDAIQITEENVGDPPTDYVVEDIPASTPAPSEYEKGQLISLPIRSARWRGNIYETLITELSEKDLFSAGQTSKVYGISGFSLQDLGSATVDDVEITGFRQMFQFGKPYVRSKSTVATTIHIYGLGTNGRKSSSTLEIPGGESSTLEYIAAADTTIGGLTSIGLSGTAPNGNVVLHEQSEDPGVWQIVSDGVSTNVANNDTFAITYGAHTVTYRFRDVNDVLGGGAQAFTQANDVLIGADFNATIANLGKAIAGDGVSGTDYYAGTTSISWLTTVHSTAGQIDLTDTIGCARTVTAASTSNRLVMTNTTAGLDGPVIAQWVSGETLPCSRVNLMLLNVLAIGQYTYAKLPDDLLNLDPYVSGDSNELKVDSVNNFYAPTLTIFKRPTTQAWYRYKLSGTWVDWIESKAKGGNYVLPSTDAVQVRVANSDSRAFFGASITQLART